MENNITKEQNDAFYMWIAKTIYDFFKNLAAAKALEDGEKFYLNLSNPEEVEGIYNALCKLAKKLKLNQVFELNGYETLEISISGSIQVIVCPKDNAVSDGFFAKLRNLNRTMLILDYAPIDTIESGALSLKAAGYPFSPKDLQTELSDSIKRSNFNEVEKGVLMYSLDEIINDQYEDSSSLYLFKPIIVILENGKLKDSDYYGLHLLPDERFLQKKLSKTEIKRIYDENKKIYLNLDDVFQYQNIKEALEGKYKRKLISELEKKKDNNEEWFSDLSYEKVKKNEIQSNQSELDLDRLIIETYSDENGLVEPLESFVRHEGETKAKKRNIHLLIFNPEHYKTVNLKISYPKLLSSFEWAKTGSSKIDTVLSDNKKSVLVKIDADFIGVYSLKMVRDRENNISKEKVNFFVEILGIDSIYLEPYKTCFLVSKYKKSQSVSNLPITLLWDQELFFEGKNIDSVKLETLEPNSIYPIQYNEKLELKLDGNDYEAHIDFGIKVGLIEVPLRLNTEIQKKLTLNDEAIHILTLQKQKSFKYYSYNGKTTIELENVAYSVSKALNHFFDMEQKIIAEQMFASEISEDSLIPIELDLPEEIKQAYLSLLDQFRKEKTIPSLAYYNDDLRRVATEYIEKVKTYLSNINPGNTLTVQNMGVLQLGTVFNQDDHTIYFTPFHPLNVLYRLKLSAIALEGGFDALDWKNTSENVLMKMLSSLYLVPYISMSINQLYKVIEAKSTLEWACYGLANDDRFKAEQNFVSKIVREKIKQFIEHFPFLFSGLTNDILAIKLVNMGTGSEALKGIIEFYIGEIKAHKSVDDMISMNIYIYLQEGVVSAFEVLRNINSLTRYLMNSSYVENKFIADLEVILSSKIHCYNVRDIDDTFVYSHLTFFEMKDSDEQASARSINMNTGLSLNGLVSGLSSTHDGIWYKTGFGLKNSVKNDLSCFSDTLNSLYRVFNTSNGYEEGLTIITQLAENQKKKLEKLYKQTNWVVLIEPKIDLSFFTSDRNSKDVMIIHYSDQLSNSNGYDDITVTAKSDQYCEIIKEELLDKGVLADASEIRQIVNLFNVVSGNWLLRMISNDRKSNNQFSREKLSILSAMKVCLAFFETDQIIWVPISMEEMLRVSGSTGLSRNDGVLSAKNLGFEGGVTSDDLLLVGFRITESEGGTIPVYLYPVEVKIGFNGNNVLDKAKKQVQHTSQGLYGALQNTGGPNMKVELLKNYFIKQILLFIEKFDLYEVDPSINWNYLLYNIRTKLINDEFKFDSFDQSYIGKGAIITFTKDCTEPSKELKEDILYLSFSELEGYNFLVKSVERIKRKMSCHFQTCSDRGMEDNFSTDEPDSWDGYDINEHDPGIFINANNQGNGGPNISVIQDPPIEIKELEQVSLAEENKDEFEQYKDEEEKETHGMTILLGTDISNGKDVIWEPNNTEKLFHTNTGIIGTMGTGKTQCTKSIITQLIQNRKYNFSSEDLGILIFDYKGDYNESKEDFVEITKARVFQPYHLPFNPFSLIESKQFRPLLPTHTAGTFVATISKAYSLGVKQSNILKNCIKKAYEEKGIISNDPNTWSKEPPTFHNVYNVYISDEEINHNDSLGAAMDELHEYEVFESDPKKTESLYGLLNGIVVIELDGYNPQLQNLIAAITLDLFYAQMQAKGSSRLDNIYRQLTKFVLVDEAENFMSLNFPSLNKVMKEGREFGVGMILSTQSLSHFNNSETDYSKYILTWIVHNVSDLSNNDIGFVFKTKPKSPETEKIKLEISQLIKHHSLVKVGNGDPIKIEDYPFWKLYKKWKNKN